MKLKNRDWTDVELRLKAADTPLLQQDRIVRATLLTIVIFGMAALTGIIGYLVWPYCIPGLWHAGEIAFHPRVSELGLPPEPVADRRNGRKTDCSARDEEDHPV
jgi:hypothetical protein